MKKIVFIGLAVMSIMSSCKKEDLTPNSETSGKTKKPHTTDQEKSTNLVWGLGSDARVYRWNPSGNNWAEPNPAARMIDISVSQDGSGAVWAIGYQNHVYRWNAASNSWDEPNSTARLSQISACTANEAWGVSETTVPNSTITYRDVYKTFNGGTTWSLMPMSGLPSVGGSTGLFRVSATDPNSAIGIGRDRKAYKFNYSTNQWSLIIAADTKTFRSLSGGLLTPCWAVAYSSSVNDFVHRLDAQPWIGPNSYIWSTPNPAGLMKMVSTSTLGVVWALGYDDRVYRWNGVTNSWDEPNPAARLRIVSSGMQ